MLKKQQLIARAHETELLHVQAGKIIITREKKKREFFQNVKTSPFFHESVGVSSS